MGLKPAEKMKPLIATLKTLRHPKSVFFSKLLAAIFPGDRSGQDGLHAEGAAASFFEFGCVYDDRGQALLAENCVQVSSPVGRDVPAIGYDSVADELVSLIGC